MVNSSQSFVWNFILVLECSVMLLEIRFGRRYPKCVFCVAIHRVYGIYHFTY